MAGLATSPFLLSANNANEAMISPRLGHEPPPKSPSEMVVESVRQHKRIDGLLDRLRLLTEIGEGSECCVERMINAEQDRVKVTLALLATGSLGSRPASADTLAGAAYEVGWPAVVEASLTVLFMASCREAGREVGGDGMKVLKRSLCAAAAAKVLGPEVRIRETESFSLGLLHEVGTLGLAAWKQAEYKNFLDLAESPDPVVERAEFGIDHTQAGLALLIYRGFNPKLSEAAAFHHGQMERISLFSRLAACSSRLAANPDSEETQALVQRVLGVSERAAATAAQTVKRARTGITALLG